MKLSKYLPVLTVALCVPGIALRALHFLNGFESRSGLPLVNGKWLWYCIGLFIVCAVIYAVLSLPLRAKRKTPFEQLLGTKAVGFRMTAVISGLLLILGGCGYLYLTFTTAEADAAGWAQALELVYAAAAILSGGCIIGFAGAQGNYMTSRSAALTLLPLLWSCVHLLVTYRMTCTDPALSSFAFSLVGDVVLVLAFYHLSRLLYGKPRPDWFALFSALAATLSVSDLAGYGLAWLMGVNRADWTGKMLLREGLSVVACLMLLAELAVLVSARQEESEEA